MHHIHWITTLQNYVCQRLQGLEKRLWCKLNTYEQLCHPDAPEWLLPSPGAPTAGPFPQQPFEKGVLLGPTCRAALPAGAELWEPPQPQTTSGWFSSWLLPSGRSTTPCISGQKNNLNSNVPWGPGFEVIYGGDLNWASLKGKLSLAPTWALKQSCGKALPFLMTELQKKQKNPTPNHVSN